jgi:predicted aspartyl protease
MTVFDWRIEGSEIFGTIKRPVVETFIKDRSGSWKAITLYIDSGADVTILSRSFGELLGFNIEKGRPARFKGFGKGHVETFLHNADIKIDDISVKTKIAISKYDDVPNVLGRYGIFDRMIISFLNGKAKTEFK